MKKLLNRISDYKFSKFQYLMLLLIPVLLNFTRVLRLDNDTWYLLNTGRYIFNHGVTNTLVFTIHNGFDMVMQNWGGTLIFYTIYRYFNYFGLIIFVNLLFLIIIYLFYKILYLVTDKRVDISVLITVVTMIVFSNYFVVSRTQMFTFIILLILIYSLELYIEKNKGKYLIILPFLSLLQINIHSTFWFMLFLFMLPYLIDSFKFKIGSLSSEGYRKKPLFIVLIIMLLVGFINPYGVNAITYIFTSFGNDIMNIYISELQSPTIQDLKGKLFFGIIFLVYFIYCFCNKNNIKIRYLLLTLGTTVLALYSVRSFSLFLIGSIFPIGYLIKEKIPIFKDKVLGYSITKKIAHYIVTILVLLFIGCCVVLNIRMDFSNPIENEIRYIIKNYDKNNVKLYVDFNNGGYSEYMGLKSYIDPRAEVFLKSNNHKFDILKESYYLEIGKSDYKRFLDKYRFTHLLVENKSSFAYRLREDSYKYQLVKENKNYSIYVRDDLII